MDSKQRQESKESKQAPAPRRTQEGQTEAIGPIAQRAAQGAGRVSAQEVQHLQRKMGNQAVGQLLHRATPRGGAMVQRTIADDLDALAHDRDNADDPLLHDILDEVLAYRGDGSVAMRYDHSAEMSHVAPHGPRTNRTYDVVIDDAQLPDDLQRQAILLHELIHVSSDQKYVINRLKDPAAQNLLGRFWNSPAYEKRQLDYMDQLVMDLYDTVDNEHDTLGDEVHGHLVSRIGRAANSIREFDTVMSELFYYANRQGIARNTETYRQLRYLANAAYERRNHQIPLLPPSQGGCFITTACVQARGLPDDCEELTVLRAFRDDYLRQKPEGEALIAQYYHIAPQLVAALQAHPDAPAIFDYLFEVIQGCVRLIKAECHEAAFETYKRMVLELQATYLPEAAPR